ncbi:DUF3800 domain-containing protein [Candidatus Saccharibacteria bacterium]|nr:DUF3800 domain-containing protein [Candidatus Saccharibacteria bacterium]
MKELSIFIDESGDFGDYDPKAPFYIIGMVLHDQRKNINEPIRYLDSGLKQIGFTRNCIHLGPLIRRENEYVHMTIEERIKVLRRMMNFVSRVDFMYKSFVVEKKHLESEAELAARLAKQVANFIRQHYPYFLAYDKVKIYYDNGQVEITKIIISIFTTLFDNTELKKAYQKDYKMSQVADLVCTATLTELKMADKSLSRSERHILGTDRDINKNLLKPLKRKEFRD